MKLIIALTLILALGSALECGDGEYVKLVVTKEACYTGCSICTASTTITGGATCTTCSSGYKEKAGATATDPQTCVACGANQLTCTLSATFTPIAATCAEGYGLDTLTGDDVCTACGGNLLRCTVTAGVVQAVDASHDDALHCKPGYTSTALAAVTTTCNSSCATSITNALRCSSAGAVVDICADGYQPGTTTTCVAIANSLVGVGKICNTFSVGSTDYLAETTWVAATHQNAANCCKSGYFYAPGATPASDPFTCTVCTVANSVKCATLTTCTATDCCASGYFFATSGSTYTCTACGAGATACTSATVHTSCAPGYNKGGTVTVCTACPVGVATCDYSGTAFTALTCEPTYYFTATAGTVLAFCTPSFTESCELCIDGCFACEDDTVCDECGEGYEDDGEGACEEEEDDGGDGGDDSSSSSLLKPIIYISMILALILFY